MSLDNQTTQITKFKNDIYTWAGFQASRKSICKLQEAVWLTVANKIFEFQPHLEPFFRMSCFFELS